MSSTARAKGKLFEKVIRALLTDLFPSAKVIDPARQGEEGADAIVSGLPLIWEAKAEKKSINKEMMDQAIDQAVEAVNTGEFGPGPFWGVVVKKRPYQPVEKSFAVMELSDFCALVTHLSDADASDTEIVREIRKLLT